MATGISATLRNSPGPAPAWRAWLRPKYLLFGVIGLMFLYVLTHSERFLIDPSDSEWAHIASFKWWLLLHGTACGSALLLGPLQFSDRLRARFTKLHRVMGRIYVAAVFIGAPMGTYIQHLDEKLGDSRTFTIETVLQAGLWMATTAIALYFIRQGKVQQHRQWMTRSFGTGPLIFMEARVIFHLFNVQDPAMIEHIVWICTASSIFVADLVLQAEEMLRSRRRSPRVPAAATLDA